MAVWQHIFLKLSQHCPFTTIWSSKNLHIIYMCIYRQRNKYAKVWFITRLPPPPTFQRKTKHRGDLLKFIYKLGKLPSSVSSDMQWLIHDLLKGGRNGLESWGCLYDPIESRAKTRWLTRGGVKLPGLGFNKVIFTVVLDI